MVGNHNLIPVQWLLMLQRHVMKRIFLKWVEECSLLLGVTVKHFKLHLCLLLAITAVRD